MSDQIGETRSAMPNASDNQSDILKLRMKLAGLGISIWYTIKKKTPLIIVKQTFCHQLRVPMSKNMLRFKGVPVKNLDTPESLGMKDGDAIKLFNAKRHYLKNAPGKLTIRVKHVEKGINKCFIVHKTLPLMNVKKLFCYLFRIPLKTAMFKFRGVPIKNLDTPESIEMRNGDSIELLIAKQCHKLINTREHLIIIVKLDNDQDNHCFKIQRDLPFIIFKTDFCIKYRIPDVAVQFQHKGVLIRDLDTAESLDIKVGDSIELFGEVRLLHYPILMNYLGEIAVIVMPAVGNKKRFTFQKRTPLIKLIRAYCHKCAIPMESVNFKFGGVLIKEEDTAETMGIEDGDIIEVIHLYPGNPIIAPPNDIDTDRIILKVFSWDNQTVCSFYTQRSIPVIKILKYQCRKAGITSQAHRFCYNGVQIEENDTPNSLGMGEGDTLDIFYAQEGGSL